MILKLYRGLTGLGGPLISLYLGRRQRRGKEDAGRFQERLGRPRQKRPPGALVWVHAASVGESLSVLPLVDAILRRPGLTVLVTTGTVTSAAMMQTRLPLGALHQYAPVDRLPWVRGFLDHWRPDLALWVESEFWPNLVAETAARRIPMVLLNGRVSIRSFRSWQRFPGLIRKLLAGFTLCLGQTEGDAERLRRLGAPHALCLGNLKLATPPLPADPQALDALHIAIGDRPVWLAASTHAGEEAIAGMVHRVLAERHPGLLTVIVPRHPNRGAEIAGALRADGHRAALRSAGEPVMADTAIYVADTMGELGILYRLCPVVFVGKSLVGEGGQNPLEPARLGCAVLFGPHMENFPDIAGRMLRIGAAAQVADAAGLADAVAALLTDATRRTASGEAARAFASAEAGVLDAILRALSPFLDVLEAPRHARP